jgi:malate permease and related proteins
MFHFQEQLFQVILRLYGQLGISVFIGYGLGKLLPKYVPAWLGQFLFWVGSPLSIIIFIYRADLSAQVWIAPIAAWLASLLGLGLAWGWMKWQGQDFTNLRTKASFLLTSMFGNTGYIGFPIILALVGEKYAGWALFYDLLGTVLGVYTLGIFLVSAIGIDSQEAGNLWKSLVVNPALWSLLVGLEMRQFKIPIEIEQVFLNLGWAMVFVSLILIGMRLSQLDSWSGLGQTRISLGIKMLIVPLILGWGLSLFGIRGEPQLVLVIQMGVPPAIASLVLAEIYDLDRDLTVGAIAIGSSCFLLTLPLWLLLFFPSS